MGIPTPFYLRIRPVGHAPGLPYKAADNPYAHSCHRTVTIIAWRDFSFNAISNHSYVFQAACKVLDSVAWADPRLSLFYQNRAEKTINWLHRI